MKLSVILPARNEERLIEKTVKDIYGYLKRKRYSFEILVVSNGCTDKTEEKVKRLSNTIKEIKATRSRPGYGYALRKGLKEATGDYIAIFNVDYYDLKMLEFVEANMIGKDLIIGSKMAHWSEDRRPFIRKIITKLFNLYLKVMYGFRGSDTHGIKLTRKGVIEKILPRCKTDTGIFDSEFMLLAQYEDLKIAEIPVKVIEKRPSRFKNRLFSLPLDLIKLHKSLSEY